MSDSKVQVAYLNGLAEGLGIDKDSKEGQIILSMIEVMNEMADEIDRLHNDQADLEDYVRAVDEDLIDLEEEVYDEEEFYEDDEDEEVYEDDDDLLEIECPECKQVFYFEEDLNNKEDLTEMMCPSCGVVVYSSIEDEGEITEPNFPANAEKYSLED